MTRNRYFLLLPVVAMVLGYLGYLLNTTVGLPYGPTGIAFAAYVMIGVLFVGEREPRDGGPAPATR